MTPHQIDGLTIGVIVVLVLALLWATRDRGTDPSPKATPGKPPRSSTPSWCAEPQESWPLTYPVPRQALDTERLLMSPDQRAFETDLLQTLWDASPDEDPPTHLPADPDRHKPA